VLGLDGSEQYGWLRGSTIDIVFIVVILIRLSHAFIKPGFKLCITGMKLSYRDVN
jgi:hypothetical protein